jgi:hypothetical protein
MARQVGIVLGVAILVTVLGGHAAGHDALPAFQRAAVVLAAAATAAGLVSLLLVRSVGRDRIPQTPAGSRRLPPGPSQEHRPGGGIAPSAPRISREAAATVTAATPAPTATRKQSRTPAPDVITKD